MWLGLFGVAIAAGVIGYTCFRFGLIGHYFAVTTLVITELVTLVIIAFRDITGGRLGLSVKPLGTAPLYFQFESKVPFYFAALALLLLSLYIWRKIDQSKAQKALAAIGEDEAAASSIGINVVKYKTGVAVISAIVAGMGGIVYSQYLMYLNPITMVNIGASLVFVFMGILGGMFTLWGPMVGAILMTGLQEYIRIAYGTVLMSWAWVGYGCIIVVMIIFLPKGLYGTVIEIVSKRRECGKLQERVSHPIIG
jgi:branched-chain amino acid transport system permease protein